MSSISNASGRVLSTDLNKEIFFSEKRAQIDEFYKDVPNILYQAEVTKQDAMESAEKNLESRINFNEETRKYKKTILLNVLEYQMSK